MGHKMLLSFHMNRLVITESLSKTTNSLKQIIPTILGVVFLLSLAIVAIPKSFYTSIFTENNIFDPLIGAVFGSVAAGSPVSSYIVGGELLKEGVSLVAVSAFVLAWVSVGIIQLPAESLMLGRTFAITRNVVSFVISIVVAILTVLTLTIL